MKDSTRTIERPPLSLILDFDGTVTHVDVGDELCARFADPSWRELDERWERKEIALPDAQQQMWALVTATPSALLEHACTIGVVRAGLDRLLDRFGDAELVLASGGFDFYIEAILGPRLKRFAAVYCNHGVLSGQGVEVSFPFRARYGCRLCAVCKGRVCAERRAAGRRVIFVGDGTSDRCVIGQVDEIWAVRDSKLARACAMVGLPAREFDSLDEIVVAP